MKNPIFLFFALCIGQKGIAQEVLYSIDRYDKYDLNVLSNEINLFVDDSVYVYKKKGVTVSKSNRFKNLDLRHISDSIYKIPGGGSIYKMDSDYQFNKILDKPTMEQSFFQSSSFINNDTIFQYGGYGNFSYKNDLIFIDSNLGTWEYYPYSSDNKVKPPNGSAQFYNIDDDKLILAGITKESLEGTQRNNIYLKEVWEFSFNRKTWAFKGHFDFDEQFDGSIRSMFSDGNHYFTNTLFNTYLTIDLKNNIWAEYQALPSLQNKIRGVKKINNYYYIIMQGSGASIQLLRVSSDRLLSKKIQQGSILIKNNSLLQILSMLLGSLFILIVVYFVIRKSKVNNKALLLKFKASNQHLLSVNEIRLINDLIDHYPYGISYKNISSYFDSNLNYETVKLKTRKLIHELNEKIQLRIKIEDLISVRKSNEDKRARIVYIKNKKKFN